MASHAPKNAVTLRANNTNNMHALNTAMRAASTVRPRVTLQTATARSSTASSAQNGAASGVNPMSSRSAGIALVRLPK